MLKKLGKHLSAYELYHQKLGNSLGTTVNHYRNSHKELGKVDKDVMKITDGEKVMKLEEAEIEDPKLE